VFSLINSSRLAVFLHVLLFPGRWSHDYCGTAGCLTVLVRYSRVYLWRICRRGKLCFCIASYNSRLAA